MLFNNSSPHKFLHVGFQKEITGNLREGKGKLWFLTLNRDFENLLVVSTTHKPHGISVFVFSLA
jgi:hypothetical protein